jgi:lipid A 3-O-deacylase
MRRTLLVRTALLLAGLTIVTSARAADPPMVSLGLGGTDILAEKAYSALDYRLEYHSGLSLLPFGEKYLKVKPWAGLEGTTRQSLWTGGGFLLDIPLGQHFVLSPSLGVGYYYVGNGKNLGSKVEFRTQFEGGYVFDNQSRLVASFGHMSNASLTKRNPGTEAALISFQMPLSAFAGY